MDNYYFSVFVHETANLPIGIGMWVLVSNLIDKRWPLPQTPILKVEFSILNFFSYNKLLPQQSLNGELF